MELTRLIEQIDARGGVDFEKYFGEGQRILPTSPFPLDSTQQREITA